MYTIQYTVYTILYISQYTLYCSVQVHCAVCSIQLTMYCCALIQQYTLLSLTLSPFLSYPANICDILHGTDDLHHYIPRDTTFRFYQ